MCVRNEELHIARALRHLIDNGVEVFLIDHASTDATVSRSVPFLGKGLLKIETMAWRGCFSLSDQLRLKEEITDRLATNWTIHVDADEWLQAPPEYSTLRNAIEMADQQGFNAINFDEFVFVPLSNENFEKEKYYKHMLRYYFYEPMAHRLMRAWKVGSGLSNFNSGGHLLQGEELRIFSKNFILRHYICLSVEHAVYKYGIRIFSKEDLEKGWHRRRISINPARFLLREESILATLQRYNSRSFDTSNPRQNHFWEW
jgi:hypothetical protein